MIARAHKVAAIVVFVASAALIAAGCGDSSSTPKDGGGGGGADRGVSTTDGGSTSFDVGNCAQPLQYYPDKDKDGFGDSFAQPVDACSPPPGMVNNPGDCADEDPDAYPGQTKFFDRPVKGKAALPYDFNCDSVVETESKMSAIVCNGRGSTICTKAIPRSWLGTKVPECGQKQQVVTSCRKLGGELDHRCEPNTAGEQTQRCR